jgi:hypothetical protein
MVKVAQKISLISEDNGLFCRSFHDTDHKLGLSSRDFTGPWSEAPIDSHYGEFKEEKKRSQSDYFRDDRREVVRHPVPGPITREKLEAAELRSEPKRNLTQLKRSTSGGGLGIGVDKKVDNKKSENQVRKYSLIRDSFIVVVLYPV